jgi:hypothetical protein
MATMRKLGAGSALAFVILALIPGILCGDWIQLHNGVQIHGKILRENPEEITLELERGGVSSFPMKSVASVHRTEPDKRKKLPLEDPPEKEPLPQGIHPRPDAQRSARRPVPGGTLLLPEDAVRENTPEATPAGDGPRFEAVYRIGATEGRIRVGRETATGTEEAQTERLRVRFSGRADTTLHALEVLRIAGFTTWVAEWTTGEPGQLVRRISGWVLVAPDTLQVVEVALPEGDFQANPYRFRVIPRSFRPQEPARAAPRVPAGG